MDKMECAFVDGNPTKHFGEIRRESGELLVIEWDGSGWRRSDIGACTAQKVMRNQEVSIVGRE
jgi:hypothetical protein